MGERNFPFYTKTDWTKRPLQTPTSPVMSCGGGENSRGHRTVGLKRGELFLEAELKVSLKYALANFF